MKVRGILAEVLASIEPSVYKDFLVHERGVAVLYLELIMAMHGMIKSQLLHHRSWTEKLIKDGFEVNPYNCCVANKDQHPGYLSSTSGLLCTIYFLLNHIGLL